MSKLAVFMKNNRGKYSYREYADVLSKFFNVPIFISYSHLANIEADRRTINEDVFYKFCNEYAKIDKDDAIKMFLEHKRIVDVNQKLKQKVKNLKSSFDKKNDTKFKR
jgi:hypothetical protein